MTHRLPLLGPLDLDLTFACGQAFRWRRDEGAWRGVVGRAELSVAVEEGRLVVEARGEDPGPAALIRYFRLDEDPAVHLEHAAELRAIPGLVPLLGLRLLRQDAWEATASFVCSAAANIRKIAACIEGVADACGEPIEGSRRRAFPPPAAIARAREKDLRASGLGFRAPFLRATARRIAEGPWSWDALRRAPIEEARAALRELPGVGPKIADCVLLFGLDRLEAYPVDRWIRRATLELSARRRAKDEELERWARRFGPGRGYLQQLIFHLRRTGGPLRALPGAAEPPAKRRRRIA